MAKKKTRNQIALRRKGPKKGNLWQGVLNTWYSMLGSVDYLESLTPYEVSNLTPQKIKSLGRKVRFLPMDGIRLWNAEQLDSLTATQLLCLDPQRSVIVAAHADPSCIQRWLTKARSSVVLQQISCILDGIRGDATKLQAVGDALNGSRQHHLAAELLCQLTSSLDNNLFRIVVSRISDDKLSAMILTDISEDLSGNADFRALMERDYQRLAEAKASYENRLLLYPDATSELDTFKDRLLRPCVDSPHSCVASSEPAGNASCPSTTVS